VGSLAETGNGLVLTVTDPDQPATAATGSFALGADTISIDAAATGPAGNRPFMVEVIDSGSGGAIVANVTGDAIVVDLAGLTGTTADIAAAIQSQLPGFTVSSNGTDAVNAPVAQQPAPTNGGAAASHLATGASGGFSLLGDAI